MLVICHSEPLCFLTSYNLSKANRRCLLLCNCARSEAVQLLQSQQGAATFQSCVFTVLKRKRRARREDRGLFGEQYFQRP